MVLLAVIIGNKGSVEREAKRQQKLPLEVKLGELRQVQDICCSSPIPKGWIKVNDHWSPTSCCHPTSITYNVCTIEKYDDKPVGAIMNVCAESPEPPGWVKVNSYWSPTSCGHPDTIFNNMKQIRRDY